MIMQSNDYGRDDEPIVPTDGSSLFRTPLPGMMYGFVPLDPDQAILRLDQAHFSVPAPHLSASLASGKNEQTMRSRKQRTDVYQTELFFG
ncbi:MAG: hypothetical protein KDA85_09585 [Planctomycetaceae bacterium]|nr:hypothetical protein [Planctomycetaceae bacterium]